MINSGIQNSFIVVRTKAMEISNEYTNGELVIAVAQSAEALSVELVYEFVTNVNSIIASCVLYKHKRCN
jgi:hypothetical protein